MHKIEDMQAFPEDFFSTLDSPNQRHKPKVNRLFIKQNPRLEANIPQHHKRERSQDINRSHILGPLDVSSLDLRLPNIQERGALVYQNLFNQSQNINNMRHESKSENLVKRIHKQSGITLIIWKFCTHWSYIFSLCHFILLKINL